MKTTQEIKKLITQTKLSNYQAKKQYNAYKIYGLFAHTGLHVGAKIDMRRR